jgi:hypothetical protein
MFLQMTKRRRKHRRPRKKPSSRGSAVMIPRSEDEAINVNYRSRKK